ncbi:MAG: 1-deoxy-D-xylulose-5-phosphate reductoisomerase [Gemmatimonadota bacterium]|nr:1-deoxy-D-xylulose-5-phosphate reductoisomerase [Gemmatimonadota bacterium]
MSAPRGVAILGATGSIGQSALNVIRRHPERFVVTAMTAHSNIEALDELAAEFNPRFVCVTGVDDGPDDPEWRGDWRIGRDAALEALEAEGTSIVLNALVGIAGLGPTIRALELGHRLALANKESLVAGGRLVLEALERGGGELLPVDSEHSAVHQCIAERPSDEVAQITLTASGGPFREWSVERLAGVRPEDALAHPTWDMGAKITIDSATLANKALEVIEAFVLFGLEPEQVRVVVHPTSIVHSFVEFRDGSCLAQLGRPTMEIPILYALGYPDRLEEPRESDGFDPLRDGPLEFEPVRTDAFPLFEAGVDAGRRGGELPIAFNAANEVAVAAFLQHRIGFMELSDVVLRTLERFGSDPVADTERIWRVDARARELAEEAVRGIGGADAGHARVSISGEN